MRTAYSSNLTYTSAYMRAYMASREFRTVVPVYLGSMGVYSSWVLLRDYRRELNASELPVMTRRQQRRKMRKITHRLLKASKGGWAETKAVHRLFIEARQWYDKRYPDNHWQRKRKARVYKPQWKIDKEEKTIAE